MAPLFAESCGAASTSCHQTGTPAAIVLLDSYQNAVLTDTTLLIAAINHTGGAKPMPKDALKLDACTIYKIEKWVRTGQPEN